MATEAVVSSLRFLDETSERLDGFEAMARDVVLLDAAVRNGQTTCRIYRWNGPWVTLGNQQTAERDLLPGCLIPSVKRPTGGWAVLHGHDLTIGLAAPIGERRSVRDIYRWVVDPVIQSLRACGVDAVLGEEVARTPSKGAHLVDCFAQVSANDIVDAAEGLKVCGCALRVTRHAVLLQCSVPVTQPLVDPSTVFANPAQYASARWDSDGLPTALKNALKSF